MSIIIRAKLKDGQGNFGHAGRPGLVGGSGPGDSASAWNGELPSGADLQENRRVAGFLSSQLPNSTITGSWYPAKMPDKSTVEIRETRAKGKAKGSYIHIRRQIPYMIRNEGSDQPAKQYGFTYEHYMIDKQTGQIKVVN